MLLGFVLGVQQFPETLSSDYLDTGRLWDRAPMRPIGPIPTSRAESYIRAIEVAYVPAYSNDKPPIKIEPEVLRFCLTQKNETLLSRLPVATGVLLRELVVEIHRRKVPERGLPFLSLINRNRSQRDSRAIGFAAHAVTALGGQVGREGAAALLKSANQSVHMTALIHLARLNDSRTLKPLIILVDSQVIKILDPACLAFLIQRGYADTEIGLQRLINLHTARLYGLVGSIVHRDAAVTNRTLLKVAGDRKEYYGTKTRMIKAMRKVDSPRHTAALRLMLGDSWALVRNAAADELVRRKDKASLPLMRKALVLKDEQNRINGNQRDRSMPMRECIRILESM